MFSLIRTQIARLIAPPAAVRRFDGAAGGRRGGGMGTFGNINSEVSASAAVVRSRARYLSTNNTFISQGCANWVAALVGAGITPTSKHPDKVARQDLMRSFNSWADDADFDGLTDFWGLQATVARAVVIDGESFVQIIETDDGPRLRVIPAELVDEAKTVNLSDGGMIISGVEFDPSGHRVAYWILPQRPTDIFATYAPSVRVPADGVLHVFRPLAPGQVRGISWLATIILGASDFDQLCDALLMGAKIAVMHAGFLVDQNGTGTNPYEGNQSGSVLEGGIEPGALKYLPQGWDIRFNSPGQAQELASFIRLNLQSLAAGLGLPEHLLSGDLTNANYSSLRAGLLPFRQRVEQVQHGVLIPQFLRPVRRRVIFSAVLSGGLEAPDFETSSSDYFAADWLPPRPMQVDPAKDADATRTELELGLTSRRKAVAERGWDIEDLDAEIAADTFKPSQKESANAGQPTAA